MKVLRILLLLPLLILTSCQTFSARQEFSQKFSARFIPEQFVYLDRARKTDSSGPKEKLIGAYSNADEFGRWGIVWAEYGKDYRGDWHRTGHIEEPAKYAENLSEAKLIAEDLLQEFLRETD